MVQVCVSEGVLEGELVDNEYGGTFCSFKGIPYAAPPVGELRFKAPQPLKPWDGVRSAKNFGQMCYQVDLFVKGPAIGSEDCLYLNIYTPDLKPHTPLPVMFWIHGGGFSSGSGNDSIFGPEFLVRHGVILVTINYRLEVLGFLCLESEEIPGNAGIKDQVAALRWVNNNIQHFGGDPNNITIFGESAGGTSVSYHLVSPMTKGLFKRAIAQSGAVTCWWAKVFKPRERALALARKLGCNSEDDRKLHQFFKSLPVSSLVDIKVPITLADRAKAYYDLNFGIVSEKQFGDKESFFYGDIYDILPEGIHEGVQVITGYTSDEGVLNFGLGYAIEEILAQVNNFREYYVPKPMALNCTIIEQLEVGRKLKEYHFNKKTEIGIQDWKQLQTYYALEMFVFGIVQWAKICSNTNNIYLYKFSCKSERNVLATRIKADRIIGDEPVTCHSDELSYLFNCRDMIKKIQPNTFRMIENITKLWTNFAKYGNPTPDDSLRVKWVPYTTDKQNYLDIGFNLVASTEPDKDDVEFWEELFREYTPQYMKSL